MSQGRRRPLLLAVQSKEKNLFISVDAQLEGEADLEFETMDANMVLAQMEEPRNRVDIAILGACRNNHSRISNWYSAR